MREAKKRLMAFVLSCLLLLSSLPVYAAEQGTEEKAAVPQYQLTVDIAGEGSVEVSGEGVTPDAENRYQVQAQTEVTITALPATGMQVSAIRLDGQEVTEQFQMPEADAVLQVTFESKPETTEQMGVQDPIKPIPVNEPTQEVGKPLEIPYSTEGIDMTSYALAVTTYSTGIPVVGSEATGTCWIGEGWTVDYPYQDYFYVGSFTGDLANAVTIRDFECLNPTAALPKNRAASYKATVAEVNSAGGYVDYEVVVTPPGATDGTTRPDGVHLSGYQHVGGKVRVYRQFTGALELRKSSANPEITNGNSCYSLKGAIYGVYDAAGTEVARLETDANGYAKADAIPAGSYTVKEITPPKGYALDLKGYGVTVTSGQTAQIATTDVPQSDPVPIFLGKVDAETTENMPQGSASFEGAEFKIKYYDVHSDKDPAQSGKNPLRTWVLKTDEDGFTMLHADYKISGDEFYYMSNGLPTLPLGTVTIQETKAPNGYLLNEEIFVRQITSKGTAEKVETYNMPTIKEEVVRGDIQIVKYGEDNDEPGDSGADIKKPLKDIKFHLTSKTTGEVYTIVTDENGFATTKQLEKSLPFDTYTVTEESPYPEYDIIAPFEVTVDEEGKTYSYILRNDTVDAPLSVQKVDKETGKVIPIAGAQFQVLDEDKNPITMEVHYPTPAEIDTFETDESGSFTLPEKLEYGTYYLHEVKAPDGYLLGLEDIQFVIDQEYDWDEPLVVQYSDTAAKGKIRVEKTDEETGGVIPEDGVTFEVRAKEDIVTPDGTIRVNAGTVVAEITTNADGMAETEPLYLGTYTVKETKAPNGYLLNPKEFEVTLEYEDQETAIVYGDVTVPDELAKGKIRVKKNDAETGNGLDGAEFEVRAREDIVTPDGTIHAKAGEVVDTVTTGEDGRAETKELYLGSYEVQETEAPEGYLLNKETFPVELIYADQETELIYGDVTVPDELAKGKIRVEKTDEETDKGLAGGVFEVRAKEDIVTPDGTVKVTAGTLVATLTTGEDGRAETKELYLGKYEVQETQAPNGYLLNKKTFPVELEYEDQETAIVYGNVTVPNESVKGKIRLKKTDAETGNGLDGAEFEVRAREDIVTPDGTIHAKAGEVVDTVTTGEDGTAETKELYLGSYEVQETEAPEGYLLNKETFPVELIYANQETELVYGDVTVPDQPAKGQITILKEDTETGNLLAGAEFTITAKEDIVTPDGTIRAEEGTIVDTIITDENGTATTKELYLGSYEVKETKQPVGFIRPTETWDVELVYADQETAVVVEELAIKNRPTELILDKKETGSDKRLQGVKFVIWNKDKEDPIDPGMTYKEIYTTDENGKIRLLYLEPGHYAAAEVESIPGYAWDDEVIFEFTVTEDGRIEDKESHTIVAENDKTEIAETNAINVSTGTQEAYAVDLTVLDTVSLVKLMPNREYVLQLILADAETGEVVNVGDEQNADMLTVEKTFTATASNMDVGMQIEFDAYPFAGRTLVVYEYLYQDGVLISKHEDPNDKKQQIYVKDELKLNTTAIDLISGTHEAIAKEDVTIRDNVEHFKLIKNQEYVLKGILMDQATEEPLVIDGQQITAEKTVQIAEADGTIKMDFTVDASELNNRSVVVYEYLYHDGQLIGSHEDINDKDQTITFKVGSLKPTLPPSKAGGLFSALRTGDVSNVLPFAVALVVTGTAILVVLVWKLRKKKQDEA